MSQLFPTIRVCYGSMTKISQYYLFVYQRMQPFTRFGHVRLPFLRIHSLSFCNRFHGNHGGGKRSGQQWWQWWEGVVKSVNRRCVLCAGVVFLWDRERITNQEVARSYNNYQRIYNSIPSSEDSTEEAEPISEQHFQEPQSDTCETLPTHIDIEETDDCNYCNDSSLDYDGSRGDGSCHGNDSSHDNEIINVDQLRTDNSTRNDDKKDNVHNTDSLFAKETLDNDSANEEDMILSKITPKSIWRKVTKKGNSSEGMERVTIEKDDSFASRFYKYIFSWWTKCDVTLPTTSFVETEQNSSQEVVESVSLTSTDMSKEEDNNIALPNPTVESAPEEQLVENYDHDCQQNEEILVPVDEVNDDTELVPLQTLDCSEFSFDKESNDEDPMSGWEFMSEQDNCTVYYKPYGDTGLYQYKVVGTYPDITARDFLDVQVNNEDRKSWDLYALKLETIDRDVRTGSEVVHWVLKFPFPMSSREYVFVRRSWISSNDDAIVIINRSVNHPAVPENKKYVRVKNYFSEMVIKPSTFIDELGLRYELTYFDDPGTYLPSSAISWVTKSAMPDYLDKIHLAALQKSSYSHQRHKNVA